MRRYCIYLCQLAVLVCLNSVVVWGGEEVSEPPLPDQVIRSATQRIWQVMEAVLENHVAPPTRQQMLHQGILAISRPLTPDDQKLGRTISELRDRTEIERVITQRLVAASQRKKATIPQMADVFLTAALNCAPGMPTYIPGNELSVHKQLLANRYVGIGIAMGNQDGYPVMREVFPRGPAARSGAKKGDLMLSIDGEDTHDLPLHAIVPKLRGQDGVPVTVVVRQPATEETRTLTITRGEAPIETVEGIKRDENNQWIYALPDRERIAYLKLRSIRSSTVAELRDAARVIQNAGCNALILDLTNVEPGELRHGVMIADLLNGEASLGAAIVRGVRQEFRSSADSLFPDWPMAVLVGNTTTGSAEWIASCLQQRPQTTLVGQRTHGLAFVTELVPLADGGAVQMRTGMYLDATGRPLITEGLDDRRSLMMHGPDGQPVNPLDQARVRLALGWNGLTPQIIAANDAREKAASTLAEGLEGRTEEAKS